MKRVKDFDNTGIFVDIGSVKLNTMTRFYFVTLVTALLLSNPAAYAQGDDLPGCTDANACNFDPLADIDDGSCLYVIDCNGICGGNWIMNECGDCYNPDILDDSMTFNYTGSPEFWTVPDGVDEIVIEVHGAGGGGNGDGDAVGGLGAFMQGIFIVTPGEELRIHVGEQGHTGIGSLGGGGGGGGSFVVLDATNTPMIIAGGGGGAGHLEEILNDGDHGRITELGGEGWYVQVAVTLGGTTDNGCGGGTGAGGGGWIGSGESNNWTNGGEFGGGAGGIAGTYENDGGYGGGGGGYHGGGGGGGYTGGSGGGVYTGCTNTGGGGGGSFNNGANQSLASGENNGHGYVIIYFEGIPDCIGGCTDQEACNFDPEAGFDDGSCEFPGCGDQDACNFEPDAFCEDNNICTYPGCIDPIACNFDDTAGCDDGSCEYVPVYTISGSLDVDINETVTYVYPSTTGSTYLWTVTGGTIISGQGTSTIQVLWTGPDPTSLSVVETSEGGCVGDSVTVEVSTFIESLELEGILVFPNPVSDFLTIDLSALNGHEVELQVFDATGRLIDQRVLSNLKQDLAVSHWADGVYQLIFTQDALRKSTSVIVGK